MIVFVKKILEFCFLLDNTVSQIKILYTRYVKILKNKIIYDKIR